MNPSTVNIHEAKTHLSRLVDEVCEGKEFILAKAGKPLVKLVPLKKAKTRMVKRKNNHCRKLGCPPSPGLAGRF